MSLQRSCIAELRPELLAQKRCSLAFASRARRSLTFETVFPVSRDRLAHGQPRRGLRLRPPLARAREDPQARAPDRPPNDASASETDPRLRHTRAAPSREATRCPGRSRLTPTRPGLAAGDQQGAGAAPARASSDAKTSAARQEIAPLPAL